MSMCARRELVWAQAKRYRNANRSEKSRILTEFCEATGYNRKYAIGLLLRPPPETHAPRRRHRVSRYASDVRILEQLWEVSGRLCSKRLVAAIPILLDGLAAHGEMEVSSQQRERLLGISVSTLDRLLRPKRRSVGWRGKTTTKPGTLLRHQIPIRTFADWSEDRPGFFEADLVAHCGGNGSGEYAYTLTLTDVYTGWTEVEALANRSQIAVCEAIDRIRRRIPFLMLGIDSDNGSEFLNAHLCRYCQEYGITFTRSRPYRKNDQCHVESKNWSVVRAHTGYERYDTPEAIRNLQLLYGWLRLGVNFLQPSMKLKAKIRNGSRVTRRYDLAKTPCQRLLEANVLPDEARQNLLDTLASLNPATTHRNIEAAARRLHRAASVI